MRIDLHAHSTASDGTDPPGRLVELAGLAGLDVVAITDHDSTAGWDEAAAVAAGIGVGLVRGTEFSARLGGRSVHLLSYLHNPDDAGLRAEIDRVRTSRVHRAEAMVARMAHDLPITWEEVAIHAAPGATIGRPHIADALVVAGIVPDRAAAFAGLLAPSGPYYIRHYSTPAAQMVRLIRAAGGFPVFAHPGAIVRGPVIGDDAIEFLVDAGLGALEVHHRDNPPDQRLHLARVAARLGLLVTGSSDYHGRGKPNRLGENLTDPDALAAIVANTSGVRLV
jgi:predicted metal-dependent phosphoesterase TrpH